MAWTDTLVDPTLKSNALAAIADNSVSYTEMLTLVSAAATGGVSSIEFQDLRTISPGAGSETSQCGASNSAGSRSPCSAR